MAAFNREKPGDPVQAGTSNTLVCEATSSKRLLVTGFSIYNGHTAAVQVEIWDVPDGGSGANGTPGAANALVKSSVAAGDTEFYAFPSPGKWLDTDGDAIFCKAATASVVVVTPYGDTYT